MIGLDEDVYFRSNSVNGKAINSISINGLDGKFLRFDHLAVETAGNTQSVPAPLPMLGRVAALRIRRLWKISSRLRHRINNAKKFVPSQRTG